MNRDRRRRPAFDFAEWERAYSDEARNRLFWFWWTDEEDRCALLAELKQQGRTGLEVPSRSPHVDDPAPPLSQPAEQGFRRPPLQLLIDPRDILCAMRDSECFSNAPYADLGGGSFLLAQDPVAAGTDWHAEQRQLIAKLLGYFTGDMLASGEEGGDGDGQEHCCRHGPGGKADPAAMRAAQARPLPATAPLRELAKLAVTQARLTTLTSDAFDLASLAEQAALRYLGTLWGYGSQDHGLLEQGGRQVYTALQYVVLGQHFCTDPGVVARARQALAALVARTDELVRDYEQLERAPRAFGPPARAAWPDGVQPWQELSISGLGMPLLKRLSRFCSPLSGRDRAEIFATLLVGTAGNIVSAVCLCIDEWLQTRFDATKALWPSPGAGLDQHIEAVLAKRLPLPVLPRRSKKALSLPSGLNLPEGTDCLLALEALAFKTGACPHAWGQTPEHDAIHPCLGRKLAMPLIEELVHQVRHLLQLRRGLDPLTGQPLALERRWGFSVASLPLLHDSDRVLMHAEPKPTPLIPLGQETGLLMRARVRNLIVAMRIKSPVAEHASALRQLIVGAVPRIDQVLVGFGHVRHAWFEFSDGDQQLVLRTLYEGGFDAYIYHFAIHAGDLFDRLFQHLEDAPPLPIAEHPEAFIETIRRFNRAPVGGYLYGA